MDTIFRPVRPVSPVAGYIGGKRNLAKRLVPLLQKIPHRTYAEPFVGMGGIFFRRDQAAPAEVINDYSRDVATLFRILQRHYQALRDHMRFGITSRTEYERLVAVDPDTLTDIERAARFLYLQKLTFGGKVASRTFGVDVTAPARFDMQRLGPILDAVHERLSGVVIECLSYAAFIPRYDREGTLFFLDPPYWDCEGDYGKNLFGRPDFEILATLLGELKGRFVMTLNDTPGVRETFGRFAFAPVETTYTVGGGKNAAKVGELVITNVPECLTALAPA
ncbi:DNA adenine methylase [Azospirillum melinis]|uniref:site-specific DNA-methyltransferase (adenine-specific) n=1 Tax=Azospirillum melinis TaxID=328839 RepID=A0ABX2KP16_9PROT|nr:DNA adenine methylase [Azospirillum melinis]MBP2310449.1 DNA adenine methylase [Azospirillum melinis]NUB04438.1 DNA adenine methylase [Azospirillum melinis]